MKVQLEHIGKRFNREWIFKEITQTLEPETTTAIVGHNGSGKSTFLQIISGHMAPTKGDVSYEHDGQTISREEIFRHVSYCAPYTGVPEEFTLRELIDFHHKLKPALAEINLKTLPKLWQLDAHGSKQVKTFSSGMKQRVKLGLAICSKAPLLLLDEPTSNLDQNGINWFQGMLKNYRTGKTIVICTNNKSAELELCQGKIEMTPGA